MNMKWYLVSGAAIIIIAAVLGLMFLSPKASTPTPGGSTTLPVATSTPISTGGSGGISPNGATITVASLTGADLVTRDFLHNGSTINDPENTGQYYLAGSIGYCLANGTCPAGAPSNEYHVVYSAQDRSFIIALIKEPLGKARQDAEQFLMRTLGINEAQMCNLKYYLSTTSYVNSFYAGQNLLFSFCPGATQLP